MADYTDTLGFHKNTAEFLANGNDRMSYMATKLDFAKIIKARAAAGAPALAALDTLEVIPLLAGGLVLAGGIEVVKAESTNVTGTFDSDVGAVALAAAVPNNAEANVSAGVADSFLAANTPVVLTLNTAAPTDAVINVWVLVVNTNG